MPKLHLLFYIVVAVVGVTGVESAEPWADPSLPAVTGLELWLDASRETAARDSDRSIQVDGEGRLATWHDASGKGRHAVQAEPGKQPRLLQVEPKVGAPSSEAPWVIRFDGQDDHLRVLGFDRRFTDFTLIVVAAPHSNPGNFRGLFAFNQRDRRDYETGFTLDMNSSFSAALNELNLEGRGFGGARDLLNTSVPFGTLHVIEAIADSGARQVRLNFDGQAQGTREFSPVELVADDITLGARYYENGPGPQGVQGFLHGDLAELLLFSRVLSQNEIESVRSYLDRKHASLRDALPRAVQLAGRAENAEVLVTVPDPPPVQMFVPGFAVRELPVELTNINNLRYRPDGKLYALGYNGDIWLLSDTDGDRLEDSAAKFFDSQGRLRGPIGMAVIPAKHILLPTPAARGVVVASKGKISALLDLDGDDIAETERVIATGWQEIPQNVDAVGIAIHPEDGAIYFGLGTAAYNNAYLVDSTGKSAFDLQSERGTIQRIAPDLSTRDTVCTGVRFTIGMLFDAAGELFVTDQEGATWLPNGNPFDELLHIRPGRHYGFPPRHPRHLPNVFDEPSLYDYGPQHQSTCGMALNVPFEPNGPIFGPENWRGDFLVCGESRGKLYRTKIARRDDGEYLAANQLIGGLSMLTVDCCLSPRGDLIVACHGGGPDWGTGPTGIGKLFAIRYEDTKRAQPVAVWAAGPQEVRVAFDRPLDPQQLQQLAAQTRITYGEYVAAGDRFESIRPGYAVTQLQQATPRYNLPVHSVSVVPDRQTLILATAPHPGASQYALTLPGLGREEEVARDNHPPQHPQVDLAYSLSGVWASWEPRDAGQSGWSGWLPHPDVTVARSLIGVSVDPLGVGEKLRQPGTLTIAAQIDLRGLFVPSVQPGSRLDYDPRDDGWIVQRSLHFECDRPFSVESPGVPGLAESSQFDSLQRISVELKETRLSTLPVTLRIETGGGLPSIQISWFARFADDRHRSGPLAAGRLVLPWAELNLPDTAPAPPRDIAELAGASWGRGRRVFQSDEAGCAKCHTRDRDGGMIGPDLSNLIHRDYASVLRDITLPNFAINPDFITYLVTLHDGRVLTGAVRTAGDQLVIGDKDGKVTTVARSEVDVLQPSGTSIMPEGLSKKLSDDQIKDLLAYLLYEPPHMPRDAQLPAPPPRSRGEVAAILAGSDPSDARLAGTQAEKPDPKPLHVLLVAGAKDHGPGEHDYPAWLRVWSELLAASDGVTVSTAMEFPSDEQIEQADTIAFFQKGSWNAERAQAIDAHLAKGGGLVYIHWAVEGGEQAPEFARRIGLASHAAKLRYRHGPLDLGFETGRDHPIGRNFERVHFHDESYWLMHGDRSNIRVLATGVEDDEPRPLFWTFEPSKGRVFVSILGHYSWTFDDPLFRILLLRGIAWTGRESVDRFNELALLGVQLAD